MCGDYIDFRSKDRDGSRNATIIELDQDLCAGSLSVERATVALRRYHRLMFAERCGE